MKRSTWVLFGIFAAIFAIALPAFALTREGSENASEADVSSSLEDGKELFQINCGACHTLAKAGTDGIVGPNLDDLLARPSPTPPDPATLKPRVLSAIENGGGERSGRMPADILSGDQAEQVAEFVSQTAGR